MSCAAPDLGEEGSHGDCAYSEKKRQQSRGLRLREEEGSHEDCAWREDCKPANRATGDLESQCALRFVPKRILQTALKTVYLLASVLILDELHTVYPFNS